MEGNSIDNELNPGLAINKAITFFIDNIENNYLLEICLCDDKGNIICSTKLKINIKNDKKNKLNFEINDDDINEIFKSLCEDYNAENMGVTKNTIKADINEYSNTIGEINSKEDFIEGIKAYIIDKLF